MTSSGMEGGGIFWIDGHFGVAAPYHPSGTASRVFWGHDTEFVVGLIGMVSLEFGDFKEKHNETLTFMAMSSLAT